jgi:hypothetical protein
MNDGGAWVNLEDATSTTLTFIASLSQNGEEFEAVFSNSTDAVSSSATLTVSAVPAPAKVSKTAYWSGYVDSGSTFSAVSASWTVTSVSCLSVPNANSSQWIGMDGYNNRTDEQMGTDADCINGSPTYFAWYELFGDNAVNNGYEVDLPSKNAVRPGDALTTTVSVVDGLWTFAMADVSNSHPGWTFSTNIRFSGATQSTAEWIVERPETCALACTPAPFANFGTASFSAASVTSLNGSPGPISSNSNVAVEAVADGVPLAVPSALETSGSGFVDVWLGQ